MASDKQASFPIVLEDRASGPAASAAAAFEALKAQIDKSQGSVRDMGATLRSLKGSSDEVKFAKDALRARIEAEKNAISKANLELLKAGTSYGKVAEQTKKLTGETKKLSAEMNAEKIKSVNAALATAGGPAANLKDRLERLKEIAGGSGGKFGLLTLAIAGTTAAVAALASKVATSGTSFAEWILKSADAARSAKIWRDTVTINATSSKNLGDQIDSLSHRIPMSKEKISEMAGSLVKLRVSGAAAVNALDAIGQASSAMGEDAGAKLKAILERGQLSQRFTLNPLELQGTGIEAKDIIDQLAKDMKTSTKKAQEALFNGAVGLDKGFLAVREVTEKKFGSINSAKMLSLDVQSEKLGEDLAALGRDVNIDPLLVSIAALRKDFGESTESGRKLKALVTDFGTGVVNLLTKAIPYVDAFGKGFIEFADEGWKSLKKFDEQLDKMTSVFGESKITLEDVFTAGKVVASGFFSIIAGGMATFAALKAAFQIVRDIQKPFEDFGKYLKDVNWKGLGEDVVNGLVGGLTAGPRKIEEAISKMGTAAKNEFKSALGIHSPSTVFAEYGEQTAAGYQKGVERSLPSVQSSVDTLAGPAPQAAPASGAARGGTSIGKIELIIQLPAGAPPNVRAEIERATAPMFAELTRFFEELNVATAAGTAVAA